MSDILSTIFKNVSLFLHGSSGCPDSLSIGECACMNYVCDDVNGSGSPVYAASLYIWNPTFNDSKKLASIFLASGAQTAVVSHVLHDSMNGDENGFTPEGSRAWTVEFSLLAEISICSVCGSYLSEKYLDRVGSVVPYCLACGEAHEKSIL